MQEQVAEQIQKHERLISENESFLKCRMALRSLVGDLPQVVFSCEFTKAQISHSKFMIQIFKSVPKKDLVRAQVSIRCMKANAHNLEESMSELVKVGYYSEQDYVAHMNGMRTEINMWERFLPLKV